MQYSDIPHRPANPARVNADIKWPAGFKSALFLGFDFDAESAWFDEDPNDWKNEISVSYGGYGARVGLPKILDLLARLELGATFFVPGWVVKTQTALCEDILKRGHEIGHHGVYHQKPSLENTQASLDEIDHGFDILKETLGITPVGYRAPCGEDYSVYLEHMQSRGIRYSSSFRDDIYPYRHVLEGDRNGPVELPLNYFLDDWMHGMIRGTGRNLVAREQVLSMWRDELEITHEWGGLTTTVFHPQVSGRPSRFKILSEFLIGAMEKQDIWITTGRNICDHFEKFEASLNA